MTCSTTAIVELFRLLEQFSQEIPMNILKQVDYELKFVTISQPGI